MACAIKLWVAVIAVCLMLGASANALLITIGTANLSGNTCKLFYDADAPYGPIVWLDWTQHTGTRGEVLFSWAPGIMLNSIALNPGVIATTDLSNGWRLPSAGSNPQLGYNQTGTELGHLYYTELQNTAGSGLINTGDFQNLDTSASAFSTLAYWTHTYYEGSVYYNMCYWGMTPAGYQTWDRGKADWYNYCPGLGIAVHDGIVLLPEPGSLAFIGVAGLILLSRCGRSKQVS